MKSLLLAALVLVSANASAEGQIASLVNFSSTAVRPTTPEGETNVTSIIDASMEYTLPENISFYGGLSFVIGETFENAISLGSRYYSSTPALQILPGIPMWSFIGGGISFLDDTVYYPEAGFRIGISDVSRLDIFVKILNSSGDTYDKHVMVGAGLTF
ncbi:MAG: hypothetical protein KJ609_02305 [Gammaproteobacteria bacterium]|jgi:hypothetical protein|uniref:Outer membrane protein beta-barrel domain-containing protein n=1 Tax=Marinomonas polaris DSM 16579 TaxID=1122206 RepID=A0A1M5KBW6_9GAMM|nr:MULTISPECIES: hypothetical protein [Marinomonas]MBU1296306.1 hypothetical protein [Gammaproteobacteria bacterium]MBU1468176.1 hypothetical protein [Gammaproteobacteria bacterium]MBU2024056.1 hypothetical protein [Gammaproteobacteria bacterium]MBU2240496.1 hypothetical protein [Gammaproteobacteria bacterium]MBU2317366.1 hypothetical protein [Gammaproteobacteria bacterium]|tara:strand:- start:1654 stop:2127 length:474 start_codon:yes stop_codon:yes gene_type:complete